MPGPSNNKGKPRSKNQRRSVSGKLPKSRESSMQLQPIHDSPSDTTRQRHTCDVSSEQSSTPSTPPPLLKYPPETPSYSITTSPKIPPSLPEHIPKKIEEVMLQEPFIYDPGNGPRVRDARAFMSSFFALPASMEDPICAEFAQEEVLQMLCTVLPEETALILWYNKSRSESRVCPACQRLYRLGDVLPGLLDDLPAEDKTLPPQLSREQAISGLCSPVCFIMASFNYPTVIKSAWGKMADEMDETTWDLLNIPDDGREQSEESRALGMLVRMTRLDDLGLAQLCFGPDVASLIQDAGDEEYHYHGHLSDL